MNSRGNKELKVYKMDCTYFNEIIRNKLYREYEEELQMLNSMANNPEKFLPR